MTFSSDSGSSDSISGIRSAIDLLLGLRLSSTPTSPNWKEASSRATRWPAPAAATARLTATVVRPTPPFGEKTVTIRPASRSSGAAPRPPAPTGSATRCCRSCSRRKTCRIDIVSSSELNGFTRNSRAPASMERRR